MRNLTLKTGALALAAIFVAGLCIAPDAGAGLLDKLTKKKGREKTDAPRYDNYPAMSFHVGQLSRGAVDSWKLGDLDLQLAGGCEVQAAGGEACSMLEGYPAIVTGALVDGTLLAYRVTVMDPNWDQGPQNPDVEVDWSDSDPTVGVGTGMAPL